MRRAAAELSDFLEEITVGVEEKREPGSEFVDVKPRGHGGLYVGEAVGQRERQFLGRCPNRPRGCGSRRLTPDASGAFPQW